MDTTALRLLETLSITCSNTLGPTDWRRLYAFTVYLHMQKIEIKPNSIRETLILLGCSFQKANWIENECEHFSELLKLYDEHRNPPL